ncbi:MAG TPA: helix-turn-helix transcriptional regulator [Longimicrobium sp.]|jgi:transcriptional regulator with XRE-family HTH domain|uniref:helix-turn-helix domain-containing protein n=1 Tax=Longimicrobium sp. TaxID=2029185 RepID=UPI002EDB6F34
MNDLDRWTAERALSDPEFAEAYERGYQAFHLGHMLRVAREDAKLTQAQLAERLGTHKSAISRMENHAEDIRLSTLQRYAEAVGRILKLELMPESEGTIPKAIRGYQEALAAAPPASVRTRRSKPAARYAEHGD